MTRKLVGVGLALTVANVLAGGLGYVFQVLMGRFLTPSDFALFAAIMAASVMLTSPISAIFTVASRNITQVFAKESDAFVIGSYKIFVKKCLISAIALVFISALLSEQIIQYINNSSNFQIVLLSLVVSSTSLGMLNNAYLQGAQNFKWLAGMSVSTVAMKILVSTFLVVLGFGINGALAGVVLSTIVAYVVVYSFLKSKYKNSDNNSATVAAQVFDFSKLPPILIASMSVAAMTQLDVFLVNNFFDPEVASRYAAAAILGKAVLYLPGGLVLALFPMVAEAQAKDHRVVGYVLTASALTLVLCGSAVALYWMFGDYIVGMLYGDKYSGVGEILKFYGLVMLPMALLIVAEYFLIALGKVVYAWLSLFFAPIQIGLIYFYHQSVFDVMLIVGLCGLLLLLSGYFFLFRLLRTHV